MPEIDSAALVGNTLHNQPNNREKKHCLNKIVGKTWEESIYVCIYAYICKILRLLLI